jgi:putative NADH-flavin reductase
MAQSPLTIGVLGPSGMGGSHIVMELLSRGHKVVGISRSPEKIGSHPRYEPRSVDLENASIQDIGMTLSDLDVLICAYGPHSSGVDAMKYSKYDMRLTRAQSDVW